MYFFDKFILEEYPTGGKQTMNAIILNGTYRHIDGTLIKVLRLEKDPVTQQDMVVYQSMDDDNITMTCAVSDFLSSTTQNGNTSQRFTYIPLQDDAEAELKLELVLDDEINRILIENDIDLAAELERRFDHVRCEKYFPDNGAKELAIVILCSCGGAVGVILAISHLLDIWSQRPRKISVEKYADENGKIHKKYEYWQPDARKSDFSVSTEIGAGTAKLTIENKKE